MLPTLYLEELKAAMRGRFAWAGAAVVLFAVGVLATVGTQDTWLDGYGVVAYFLVPLAFMPFAAAAIAAPRANRFVESVFTAPVERRDWFLAKILVLVTFGLAYNVALVPMMLVYVHHVGLPFLLHKFLWWTPALVLTSIAVGTLIGVLFIGPSVGPPIASAVGAMLVTAALVPLQELLVAQGNGATRTGHVALVSAAVVLKNALGFAVAAANIPSGTTGAWASVIILVVGAPGIATWIFLRAQGVETWETTPTKRWIASTAIVAVFLAPVALAETNYDRPTPAATNAPVIRGVFSRGLGSLALVETGHPLPGRCCNTILNRDAWPYSTDEDTTRDLIVLLPVENTIAVSDVTVTVAGAAGLDASTSGPVLLEPHTYATDAGPLATDGHHIQTGWVARIPVVLHPTKPWDIGGLRYPIDVSATYRVAGDARPRTLAARAAIDAQVGPAIYEMAAASMILPFACFIAGVVRWRRTR